MQNTVYLVYPSTIGTIAPEIYGHFTELLGGVFYDGLWVGRDSSVPNIDGFRLSLIEALKKIAPPVLRWPGGCFAETYDWRDGIGENRPVRRSWWTNDDGRYEPNHVGTHEFVRLCELVGAKPYFAANITSVTPMHIREWMDYCLSPEGSTALAAERAKNGHPAPFDIPYWGVGNENWGGGGNMTPEYYGMEYRRFATVMSNTAPKVKLFACGSSGADYSWTQGLMPVINRRGIPVNGFAMHYYCGAAGDPVAFTNEEWDRLLAQAARMEEIVTRNWNIISGWDMQDRCALVVDEWGCWHPDGSGPSKGYNLFEQQSTMRDAMVSALTLNIFNRHADKVIMANAAQLVNNLHTLFLAGGDRFCVTPTYHVFDMYKGHQGARAFEAIADNAGLTVSASEKNGRTLLTIGNLSCTESAEISLKALDKQLPGKARLTLLAHEDLHAHNTFETPEEVKPRETEIDPKAFTLPAGGIAAIEL